MISSSDQTYLWGSDPRLRSYSANGWFCSGYHEVLPTNNLKQIDAASLTGNVILTTSAGSAYPPVNSSTAKQYRTATEGARTDTASTILSGRDGSFAGHTGSGISTVGQADAHDLLRESHIEAMQTLTDSRAMAVFIGALSVASMAPMETIKTVYTSTLPTLKDTSAIPVWEQRRDEVKAIVKAGFDSLGATEKQQVINLMNNYYQKVHSAAVSRQLEKNASGQPIRPTSPIRTHGSPLYSSALVAGMTPAEFSRSATAPFRGQTTK